MSTFPNAPAVDPPIPHCPYCGKLSSSVPGIYTEPRCDHRCRERAGLTVEHSAVILAQAVVDADDNRWVAGGSHIAIGKARWDSVVLIARAVLDGAK